VECSTLSKGKTPTFFSMIKNLGKRISLKTTPLFKEPFAQEKKTHKVREKKDPFKQEKHETPPKNLHGERGEKRRIGDLITNK